MKDETMKHLEFIQVVITRMNTNSFQIKGWMVTIAAAVLALFASTQNRLFVLCGLLPTVLFWCLDAHYLTQERRFRGLYTDVAGVSDSPQQLKEFEMRPDLYSGGKYSYWRVFRSQTIWPLYLAVIASLGSLFTWLKYGS